MPRNPRPDQIGIGGRMLSEWVAGSSRNTHFDQGGLLDSLKKALTERALNAENHHLASSEIAGTTRNGYGRKVK